MAKTATRSPQTSLFEEIMVDGFAGGGGFSTGAELAMGMPVHIAINHDPDAVAMHEANHPHTEHYCESIFAVKPLEATRGRPVGWAHFSPDCKHFSKAKGGKPIEKKIRGLAWVVLRWAGEVRPRVISLENVEEFQTWGPVRKGKPVKNRRGETFRKFVAQLEALGYVVEWRELKACDYGAPTIRKRFFLLARCDGKPIVWPESTHAAPDSPEVQSGKLLPWRTAAEIIDWSLPCPSIFTRKRPLAANTLRRVAKGVDKFTIKNPQPFLVTVNHTGEHFRGQDMGSPMHTHTAKNGTGVVIPSLTKFQQNSTGQRPEEPIDTVMAGATRFGVVSPTLVGVGGRAGQSGPRPADTPTGTTTAKADVAIVAPSLIQYHQETSKDPRAKGLLDPVLTVDTANRYALVSPVMTAIGHSGFTDDRSFSPDEPTLTAVTKQEQMLLTPTLVEVGYGEAPGQAPRAPGLEKPLGTVVEKAKHAVVAPSVAKYFGSSVGSDCEDPLHTVTATDTNSLVSASMFSYRKNMGGRAMDEPMDTVSTIEHGATVAAHLLKMKGQNYGHKAGEPLQTITAGGRHFGVVEVRVERYTPGAQLGHWPAIRAMFNEYLDDYNMQDDEVLVFRIDGADYVMVDIGLRMLTPRELYNAQGFPPDYIIDHDQYGNVYPLYKQVARCGNAVPPPFATALVRANWPEVCVGLDLKTMADFMAVSAV